MESAIDVGRAAFAEMAWAEARAQLLAASPERGDDLECLAVAAYLSGHDADSAESWARAHAAHVESGDPQRAGRCAFWLGLLLLLRGESARASGWLARAARIADGLPEGSPLHGYLSITASMEALGRGDGETAATTAHRIVSIGESASDPDLLSLGLLCSGEAAVAVGDTERGLRRLDEAMVAVTTGEVSPIAAGIVYCAVIDACVRAFDLGRAGEWVEALSGWCDAQPDLVPYRGQCRVHRSQILQAHGAWDEAVSEAERARADLAATSHPALGAALYQEGELHRLRGDLAAAEAAYRAASEHGCQPVPGLALLRLAAGDVEAASASIRRLRQEGGDTAGRPDVLIAAVRILVAAGELDEAEEAAAELDRLATASDVPVLRAASRAASGALLLARGDAAGALPELRQAVAGWREHRLPYEEAEARVRLAEACRLLGDHDGAELELATAQQAFERLGAGPDLDRLEASDHHSGGGPGDADPAVAVLTTRERQVVRLVASGMTNRAIAAELVISEHTVARHLQNVFTKLGISSRAAATAFAYEHGLA